MKSAFRLGIGGLCLLAWSLPVAADDLEGRIESVDGGQESFVVQGIRFFVTAETDFDDGLRQFGDLRADQRVEVDFEYREGRHYAEEIELED
ncbi:DUF5666 domain-containing protein [Aquisalimonas lutea]|uniref:DUF5666 domain-containing protein n=1 Tax=Aquisalimonas lutea TaxID=1327750 RepID=UPI0025B5286C|nr:DUF5666 domain-containing protein [Aquisalimonas lutea]MDN3517235.1 DUF5666 domain-containing protein [Aquisalimonas lutea]